MGTLTDIKTRVATQMVKDDLLDVLAPELLQHIQDAVEFFADEKFAFNALIATVNTTGGSDTVTLPATVRSIDRVTIPAQSKDLKHAQLDTIEDPGATGTGVPCWYAWYNDQLVLRPTPNAAYAMQITGVADFPALVADADSNVWTNEGAALIVARAKFTLYRDQYRDSEGASLAAGAVQEAYTRLRRTRAQRGKTKLRSERYTPATGFNITAG